MACFIASAAEAIIVTIVRKNALKKEEAAKKNGVEETTVPVSTNRIPWSRKLGWLQNMLWGGSFLLAIEHIWHGEVVAWPPFLTALNNPADIQPMLMEIAIVGGSMVLLVTIAWYLVTRIAEHRYQKTHQLKEIAKQGAAL